MKRTWTDQPEVLENMQIVFSSMLHNGTQVEVRKLDKFYYVSIENLFGSQTILCENEVAMWKNSRIG